MMGMRVMLKAGKGLELLEIEGTSSGSFMT